MFTLFLRSDVTSEELACTLALASSYELIASCNLAVTCLGTTIFFFQPHLWILTVVLLGGLYIIFQHPFSAS
jgi:hypothetical protein